MAKDPELSAHLEWLGYIQPVGLVVSPPALLQAQAHINRNVIPQHQRFLSCLPVGEDDEPVPQVNDFPGLVRNVLDWQHSDLIAFEDAQAAGIDVSGLEVVLPEYNETLRPTWVVPEFQSKNAPPSTSATSDSPVKQKASGKTSKSLYADEDDDSVTAKCESVTELVSEDHTIVTYRENVTPSTDDKSSQPSAASQPSNASRYVMLIQQVPASQDLDEPLEESDRRWHASPHARFERLLRETQVPAGLLTNGRNLRLVYSPRGETSGYLTFNVDEMTTVAGRPIFAAFHMLLNSDRLFNLEKKQRLPAILAESRKYQNTVSTQLAQQVMAAMYELLRGFQAADDQWNGRLLKDVLAQDPQHVYHGLVTVLMRTVFVLYAEDRNLLSNHPVYTNYYAITGLFERLRADAGQYPDTMDQRYGAWAQLLTLFRMIYCGGSHNELQIPPRKGYLFDPNRYPFLEGSGIGGRGSGESQEPTVASPTPIPRISDGVIYRVLNNLLLLDGERLSYRSLDVEQIGSVYEAIMGFEVQVSTGRSIAIKPVKKHGAPATINLEELLNQKAADRVKWLKERTDQSVTGQALEALKSASTIEDLLSALDRKIDNLVTPNVVPANAMIFQPSDERRRSGSHYTPRSFTEPVVRTTLKPILDQLGPHPRPEQILALKICDPAMGSGAFLVEVCRQLAEALVAAWYYHDCVPQLPPDEDELLHARRLIAQRCLYGVDKNPMAVDLAKLSLWLVTLAKYHPFTFVDHSLRCGDSLVGLTREQIVNFTWQSVAAGTGLAPKKKPSKRSVASPQSPTPDPRSLFSDPIAERMRTVTEYRQRILAARDDKPYEQLRQELDVADEALSLARLTGDCVIAAFFSAAKDRERVARLDTLARQLVQYLGPQRRIEDRQPLTEAVASLHGGDHPLQPFHWHIEFPEVFTVDAKGKPTGGFDAIVGNPPFIGGRRVRSAIGDEYFDWLEVLHEESSGNADLVAHFFRRAFNLLRSFACFGLIATKTIGQGDTRSTGLRWICTHDGTIYAARKRVKWPGQAAVVVSVVRVCRGKTPGPFDLDGCQVPIISAYLFHAGGHDDPETLKANEGKSFIGSYVLGMGFTFDDTDNSGVANPLSVMHELIAKDPRNAERIFPYIGGEEANDGATYAHHRYVINFGDMPLRRSDLGESWRHADGHQRNQWLRTGIVPTDFPEPVAADWPDVLRIVEEKVKPERTRRKPDGSFALRDPLPQRWWHYADKRPALSRALEAIRDMDRVLVRSLTSKHFAFAFLPQGMVYDQTQIVFAFTSSSAFGAISSRVHEVWASFFGATLEDRPRYNIVDCFETFPFPAGVLENATGDSPPTDNRPLTILETAGREYYEFRATLMVHHNEGLTKTYNRFHDPHETSPDILQLRALHAAMDRAVLEAYGWHDLAQTATCEFLLDYEDDEDEDEGSGARSPGTGRQKKKPWRYRWPDPFRDEVLARLLELNKQRHKEELLAGTTSTKSDATSSTPKSTSTGATPKTQSGQQEMF